MYKYVHEVKMFFPRRSPRLAAKPILSPETPVPTPVSPPTPSPPIPVIKYHGLYNILKYTLEVVKSINDVNEQADCVIHAYEYVLGHPEHFINNEQLRMYITHRLEEVEKFMVSRVDLRMAKKIRLTLLFKNLHQMMEPPAKE